MTAWVPVVDLSRHQGAVDFRKMKAKGVRGLILRIAHGLTLDDRFEVYWSDAINAGFAPDEVGAYPFLNPKRGTGAQTAAFAVDHIRRITGAAPGLYMLDVENYRDESPNVGQAPVFGAAYAAYIREHIATVARMAPKARVIGYTNRAYWNGRVAGTTSEWVGDDQLAASLDWIVARYPAYSLAAYARRPLPDSPDGWAEWAFKVAPDGPYPPRGASGWEAWQMSAGFNRQGPVYGASSDDLDLNIVHEDAWARWTGKTATPTPNPNPPQEDDMPAFISNKTAGKYGAAPSPQGGCTIWERVHNAKSALSFESWVGYGMPFGIALDDATLDGIPDWVETSDPATQKRLATLEDVTLKLNDAVGRVGQSVGDIQSGLIKAGGG